MGGATRAFVEAIHPKPTPTTTAAATRPNLRMRSSLPSVEPRMQSRTGACYPGRPVGDVMAITKGAFRCRTDTVRVGLTRQRRSVLEFGYGPLALIQASGDAGSRRNHRRGLATYDRAYPSYSSSVSRMAAETLLQYS